MTLRGGRLGSAMLVCVLGTPGVARAAVSFSSTPYALPAANSEYNSRLGAVSVVDLNNDSRPDIVVYRSGGSVGKLFVLLNQGGGTFAAPQEYAACANSDGGTMVTGQFDAGQAADVILGCQAGTGPEEHLGNGDGTLGAPVQYAGIGLNYVLTLWPGDDGAFADVLYPQGAGQDSLCYRPVDDLANAACPPDTSATDGNGDPGGHAALGPALATGHFYSSPACPRDDVIVSPYQRGVRAWGLNPFGNPPPRLGPCESLAYVERPVSGIPVGENLTHISTTDLNGDGVPDLLMSTSGSSVVALLWQTGAGDVAGGFPPGEPSVVTPTIVGIEDQQAADFDGDGRQDIALVGESSGVTTATLAVQRGLGDGSFATPPVTFAVPGGSPDGYNSIGPNHLAVGDLNGDGRPDLVSIAQDGGDVTVLLNSTVASPAGVGSSPTTPPATPLGTPLPTTTTTTTDTVAPTVTAVSLSNHRFAAGAGATAITARAKHGTRLRYTLSEAARVTIAIVRRDPGRRKGPACVTPTRRLRHAKRCTISTREGTLTRSGAPGANSVAFSGRIGSTKLAPGIYRMTLSATDAASNRSRPSRIPFEIVRP